MIKLRYLFFDIECANCDNGNGKICSFGYVITDTSFNIIKKEDIIINPRSHFFLKGRNNSFEIILAYPAEVFRKAPPFPHFYKKIKEMLEDKDTLIFGHAVYNDVNFLKSECQRYKLPCIDYHFNDSQLIYQRYKKIPREVSLTEAAAEFGLAPDQLHKSDDDALLTMKLVREMCNACECTLPELIERYPKCDGEIKDFQITRNNIAHIDPALKLCGKNYAVFDKFINTVKPERRSKKIPKLENKRVSFTKVIEKRQFRIAAYLIQQISNAGGKYSRNPLESDIFVRRSDVLCQREADVDTAIDAGADISKITFAELMEILGISEQDLIDNQNFDIESIVAKNTEKTKRRRRRKRKSAGESTQNSSQDSHKSIN